MKLCYLGWGDHVHLERWAGYFARLGERVSVISASGRGDYPPGVEQYSLLEAPLGRFSYRATLAYLRYALWRIKPDLVHVHWANFAKHLRGRWKGPVVITVWGSEIYQLANMPPGTEKILIQCLREADAITCDSRDLAHAIERLASLDDGAVDVIQWGVDTELFKPAPRPGTLARKLGIAAAPVVLSPRNFTPLYNLDALVSAFAKLHERLPEVTLVMKRYNSTVDYNHRIQSLIVELGLSRAVHVVDEVPYAEMPDFYRTGEIIVSIPNSDGTPMSLLEGMASGCVPIASDLPSLREWIKDGENGFLVDPADTDGIADILYRVLRNPKLRNSIRHKNLALITDKASQDVNMHRMLRIYSQAVSSSAGSPPDPVPRGVG